MNTVQTDATPSAMTRAIIDNLIELFPAYIPMMPGAERIAVGESAAYLTDIQFPLFNGLIEPRLDESNADAAIDTVVARARARQVPMLWWLTPESRPADIGERLEARATADVQRRGVAQRARAGQDPRRIPGFLQCLGPVAGSWVRGLRIVGRGGGEREKQGLLQKLNCLQLWI